MRITAAWRNGKRGRLEICFSSGNVSSNLTVATVFFSFRGDSGIVGSEPEI